jgi:hypothetical protein
MQFIKNNSLEQKQKRKEIYELLLANKLCGEPFSLH